MTYDPPATIRRRQQRQESSTPRRGRAATIKVLTDAEWSVKCDFHIEAINTPISVSNAAAHARALVHMAIERRAAELQRDLCVARWKAVAMARIELLNVEAA